MIRLLFLCTLIGCEQIEPSGDPLKPIAVDSPTITEVDQPVDDADSIEEEETFSISSEELAAIAEGGDGVEPAPTPESTPTTQLPEQPSVPMPPPPPAAPPPPASTNSAWSKAMGKAWPVRLVTTIPNASPPRAILGLPDGKEIVVNPGSMVPDLGLVVVAISPGSAELAKIAPAGDHATIESVTLRSQY